MIFQVPSNTNHSMIHDSINIVRNTWFSLDFQVSEQISGHFYFSHNLYTGMLHMHLCSVYEIHKRDNKYPVKYIYNNFY